MQVVDGKTRTQTYICMTLNPTAFQHPGMSLLEETSELGEGLSARDGSEK